MKIAYALICLALTAVPQAQAQDKEAAKAAKPPSEKQVAQRERMKDCNERAGKRKGDDRKNYLSECLKGADNTQQDRMKTCNRDAGAKNMKGEERKKFMSACLSGKDSHAGHTTPQERMKHCNNEAGDKKLAGDERKRFMSACLKD
jgi:hypothetical protein